MKVLVTGSGGFIGGHVARRLAQRGHSVLALYRRSPPSSLDEFPNVLQLQAELSELQDLPDGIESVVHAAATSPSTGVTDGDLTRDNVVATQRLLKHVAAAGVSRVVYLSSLSVHGKIETDVVDEATPIRDPDAYGLTKYEGELMLAGHVAASGGALAGLAIRLPNVVGRGAKHNWLSTTLSHIRGGQGVTIFNPDAPFNNAVHVEELSIFIASLLAQDWTGFDVATLAASDPLPIATVVQRLIQATGASVQLHVRGATRRSYIISSRKAMDRYGYSPSSLGDILDRYVRAEIGRDLTRGG